MSFAKGKSDAVAKLDGSYKLDKERSRKSAAARGEDQPAAALLATSGVTP